MRGDLEDGPAPGDLEAAQLRKIHHVLQKARVKSGDRILEFGSGWGGLAIEVTFFLFQGQKNTNHLHRLFAAMNAKLTR